MLICFDCEREMRNEYLDKIKKENGIRYRIKEQHSKIKKKLMDDDNISSISNASFYTDNNSYNPNSKKCKKNMKELKPSLNRIDSRNLFIDTDKLSVHSYNGIITDYSNRRKKNKIRNPDFVNKESNQRISNIKKERKNNMENDFYNNINEKIKNERISDYNMKIDDINNSIKKSSLKNDENDSNYDERYNELKYNDNYTNKKEKIKINKNNYFNNNDENLNKNNEDEIDINNLNKTNNENINKKRESFINKNNNIEFNNIMTYEEKDNLSEHSKNSLNIPEKNENISDKNRPSENRNNPEIISNTNPENNDKRKKYKIYNENNNDLYESNSKKNINRDNESISETDEIHKSIYYERNENNLYGESKYIRKDKIKRHKKVKSKNKKTNNKNIYNNLDNQQLDNESEQANYESSNDKKGNVIFHNKYVDSDLTEINKCCNDNDKIDNKRVLYQDFYFREVSFSSSSSVNNFSDSKFMKFH